MKQILPLVSLLLSLQIVLRAAPPCTALGDQTTYGTNNVWIGYAYQGKAFTTYYGYVNEGSSASPAFDESFGGDQVNYSTNGCPVYTEDFAMRYKLTKTFADATYTFTVGGDDGYRLSLDGGSTWAINNWGDHGYTASNYTVHLNGSYNLVLEYYENGGGNRISFDLVTACVGSSDPNIYGTNNIWRAYVYSGMNFETYKGYVTEGVALNPNFNETFGGDNVTYNTSDCPITTEQFSVRYRLQKAFSNGTYTFAVGGDDGFRLSLDGGSTWIINNWNDQSYTTSTVTMAVNGTKSMILEYYENGGQNQVSFTLSGGTILSSSLLSFEAKRISPTGNELSWKTSYDLDVDHFNLQRSDDGNNFNNLSRIETKSNSEGSTTGYTYVDNLANSQTVYYRIEFIDREGKSSYSNVLKMADASLTQPVRIFPTIVYHTGIFIETSKTIVRPRVEIFDLTGNRMSAYSWESISGNQPLPIGMTSALIPGTYIVRLTSNGRPNYSQLIIVR